MGGSGQREGKKKEEKGDHAFPSIFSNARGKKGKGEGGGNSLLLPSPGWGQGKEVGGNGEGGGKRISSLVISEREGEGSLCLPLLNV